MRVSVERAYGDIKSFQQGAKSPPRGCKCTPFSNLNITLPSLDEQQKIVQFLDRFDKQNEKVNTLIQQSLSQIDLLKKSILDRAFRGQLGTQDPSDPDARDLLTRD